MSETMTAGAVKLLGEISEAGSRGFDANYGGYGWEIAELLRSGLVREVRCPGGWSVWVRTELPYKWVSADPHGPFAGIFF